MSRLHKHSSSSSSSRSRYGVSTEEAALQLSRSGRTHDAIELLRSTVTAYEKSVSSETTLESWTARLSVLQTLGNIQEATQLSGEAVDTYMKILKLAMSPGYSDELGHTAETAKTPLALMKTIQDAVHARSPFGDHGMFMTPGQAAEVKNYVFPPSGILPLIESLQHGGGSRGVAGGSRGGAARSGVRFAASASLSESTSEGPSAKYESESDGVFSHDASMSGTSVDSMPSGRPSSGGASSDSSIRLDEYLADVVPPPPADHKSPLEPLGSQPLPHTTPDSGDWIDQPQITTALSRTSEMVNRGLGKTADEPASLASDAVGGAGSGLQDIGEAAELADDEDDDGNLSADSGRSSPQVPVVDTGGTMGRLPRHRHRHNRHPPSPPPNTSPVKRAPLPRRDRSKRLRIDTTAPAPPNPTDLTVHESEPMAAGTQSGGGNGGGGGSSASTKQTRGDQIQLLVSNSLLNLGKILQDGLAAGTMDVLTYAGGRLPTTPDLLAVYTLSLSIRPLASTANNIGVLLAALGDEHMGCDPQLGLGRKQLSQLAYDYYLFGLKLDAKHPHLYTNLGSLLREHGKVAEAKEMYAQAVHADRMFATALANLALCFKEEGDYNKAITCYKRATRLNPSLVDPLVGLLHSQGVVCEWKGRGSNGWEQVAVDAQGNIIKGRVDGYMARLARAIDNQLAAAARWGNGTLRAEGPQLFAQVVAALGDDESQWPAWIPPKTTWARWQDAPGEGANVLRLIELSMRAAQRRCYIDRRRPTGSEGQDLSQYPRVVLPSTLPDPHPMAVLPFHAFTLPLSADQVRGISERTADRVAMVTLRSISFLSHVYPPPEPPANSGRTLKVGYVSSDFANHPLSHLMQSVFGMHDSQRVLAYCYATSPSDNSQYRHKIEREAHVFRDVSEKTVDEIADEIARDGIHILVNLNGFTKGGRNEIFALRPSPIQVSLMGFAGPMGASWCDYIFGDTTAMPPDTSVSSVYQREKIVYMPTSFFCNDHLQSAPDASRVSGSHANMDTRRAISRRYRTQLFPELPDNAFILANFNQLYKIDPTTFLLWLRILERLPNAYLWLLRFPKAGEANLLASARRWTGPSSTVPSRILFTDVASKEEHLQRCHACDLFLDTPECNAHTTAVDVLWAGTPMVTYPRHAHKLCSRIAASVIKAAASVPSDVAIPDRLITSSEREYEERVVYFGGAGRSELEKITEHLLLHREEADLFQTSKWVRNLENAYDKLWRQWINGVHDHVVVDQ